MYEAQNKVVLVTGGAAGIGASIVRVFLEEGAKHVAAVDIDVKQGKLLEEEINQKYNNENKIKFHKCDVTTNELDAVFNQITHDFGHIDVVVNCAGIMNDSPDKYVKEIDVNLTALIRSSMIAIHHMRKDHGGRGGSILNISSIVALMHVPLMPIYAATKTAVLQFSTSLGLEPRHSSTGVRVMTICFGVTDTSLIHPTKLSAIDAETNAFLDSGIKAFPIQTKESAAQALIEAFKNGASASTWLITSGKPAQDITASISKGFEEMSQHFNNEA